MIPFRANPGGLLVFVDTTDISIMGKQEHPDLADVEWDPTGRYVTSYVNIYHAKVLEQSLLPRFHHRFSLSLRLCLA